MSYIKEGVKLYLYNHWGETGLEKSAIKNTVYINISNNISSAVCFHLFLIKKKIAYSDYFGETEINTFHFHSVWDKEYSSRSIIMM